MPERITIPTIANVYDAIDNIYATCPIEHQKRAVFERLSAFYPRSDSQLSQVIEKV